MPSWQHLQLLGKNVLASGCWMFLAVAKNNQLFLEWFSEDAVSEMTLQADSHGHLQFVSMSPIYVFIIPAAKKSSYSSKGSDNEFILYIMQKGL